MTDRILDRLKGLESQLQQQADRFLRSAETHSFHAIFEEGEVERASAREAAHRAKGALDTYKYAITATRAAIEDVKGFLK